jgi:hypothetical protein
MPVPAASARPEGPFVGGGGSVGGDIDGLAQLADTLYAYCPQVSDVAATLSGHVERVVGAMGRSQACSAARRAPNPSSTVPVTPSMVRRTLRRARIWRARCRPAVSTSR